MFLCYGILTTNEVKYMNEKQKSRPRYGLVQNAGWMLARAAEAHRYDVPLLTLVVALAAAGSGVAGLLLAPEVVRCVEEGASVSRLLETVGALAAVLLVCNAVSAYLSQAPLYARVDVRLFIIRKIHYKTCVMAYPHIEDPKVLQLMEQTTRAVMSNNSAAEAIWTDAERLLTAAVSFAVYLLLLTRTSAFLIAALTATTVAEYFINRRINEWGYRHRDEAAALEKKVDYVTEKAKSTILGKDIRIFGMRPWLEAVYDKTLRALDAFAARRERVYFRANVVDAVLTVMRNGLAYYVLLRQTLAGGLGAAEFLLCFSAVGAYTEQLNGVLTELGTLRKQSLELCTIRDFLELPEPFRMEGGKPLPVCTDGKYELRLENVSFRYPGTEVDTLRGIDLTVQPGERLAVVGLNGAGKTTLVKLLCGFYDPTEGRVLLNGTDIREFNRREYYSLFTAVFQKFSVLEVTLEENVTQTDTGIDEARVWDCLEKAGLGERVRSMPDGLKTHIGREVFEDGILLSGGEMQRLMLARALYKSAPILLLDEPTAALDPIAENDIYQKYAAMTKGRTSVFISHRLASTRFCDRILLIDGGIIAEQGSHESLLAHGGKYAELFEVQSRYYREEAETDGRE